MAIAPDKLARKLAAFMTLAGFVFILVYAARNPVPPPAVAPILASAQSLANPLILRRDDPKTGWMILEVQPHAASFEREEGARCYLLSPRNEILWKRMSAGPVPPGASLPAPNFWRPNDLIFASSDRLPDDFFLLYAEGSTGDQIRCSEADGKIATRPWHSSDSEFAAPEISMTLTREYVQFFAAVSPDTGLGLEFSVCQRGKTIAVGEGYSHRRESGNLAANPIWAPLLADVKESEDGSADCIVEVTARPDLAMRDLAHDTCWHGHLRLSAALVRNEAATCRPASPEQIARHMPRDGGLGE